MQSKNLSELRNLAKKLKHLLKEYNVLEDIIFFGSFVKEKTKPKDIDIALLLTKKDESEIGKIEQEIRKLITNCPIDFTHLTIKEVYSKIWLSVIKEGFSIAKQEFFSEMYGIKPVKLYKYSLTHLNKVQKVQFARGLKNVVEETSGIRLTRTIVLIPLQQSEKFESFLQTWNIEFETKRYELIPESLKPAKIVI